MSNKILSLTATVITSIGFLIPLTSHAETYMNVPIAGEVKVDKIITHAVPEAEQTIPNNETIKEARDREAKEQAVKAAEAKSKAYEEASKQAAKDASAKAEQEKEEQAKIAAAKAAAAKSKTDAEAKAKVAAEQAAHAKAEQEKQAQATAQSNRSTFVYTSNISDTEQSAKEWIANKESGGSYTAVNGRFYGRYQLDISYLHGDLSAANQEKTADNYVKNRYGSWFLAKQAWLTKGWY